jgi:hypothetical protein
LDFYPTQATNKTLKEKEKEKIRNDTTTTVGRLKID